MDGRQVHSNSRRSATAPTAPTHKSMEHVIRRNNDEFLPRTLVTIDHAFLAWPFWWVGLCGYQDIQIDASGNLFTLVYIDRKPPRLIHSVLPISGKHNWQPARTAFVSFPCELAGRRCLFGKKSISSSETKGSYTRYLRSTLWNRIFRVLVAGA